MGNGRWEVDGVDKRDGKNGGDGITNLGKGIFQARGNGVGLDLGGGGGDSAWGDIVPIVNPGGMWDGSGLTPPAGIWTVFWSGWFSIDGSNVSPGQVTTLLNADGFEGNWAAAGAETLVFDGLLDGTQKLFPLVAAIVEGTWRTLLLTAHRH